MRPGRRGGAELAESGIQVPRKFLSTLLLNCVWEGSPLPAKGSWHHAEVSISMETLGAALSMRSWLVELIFRGSPPIISVV